MYVASALVLRDGDRSRLEALVRMTSAPSGLVQRARIVLLAADGVANTEIAESLGSSRPTVLKWRSRYAESGIEALGDLPRAGRPGTVDEVTVLVATLADDGRPPAAGRGAGAGVLHDRQDLAEVGHPAAPGGDVQVLHRS